MADRRGEQPPPQPTQQPAACHCGSHDHQPLRVGETLSLSGEPIPVVICPAESASGLEGAL
jgi:hypothetical protein